MSAPSVAVIVATRDRPELLRQAVASILGQRYEGRIEVFAVFDQSEPDHDLAHDFAHVGDSRAVRVLANGRAAGLAGARNTGIEAAADHDLVAFCDDDDLWLPSKLEAQVELLAHHPEMEVVTTGILVEARGRVTPRVLLEPAITHAQLVRSRVMEAHPSTFLARRSAVVKGIGLIDEAIPGSYGEDYDWLLRAARRSDIGSVNLPLVKVFWHRSSFFAERWQTIVTALDYLLEKHPELRDDPAGLARIEGQQAFALAALGDGRGARKLARRAIGRERSQRRAWLALAVSTPLLRSHHVLRLLQRSGRGV
ncbi:hypothetical protein BH24ACT3_BH24ACT3_05090 [soil metagenome]